LAKTVIETLVREGLIDFKDRHDCLGQKGRLIPKIDALILDELQAEDRLNAKVREIMKAYEKKIRDGEADYPVLFQMIKKQLIRDMERAPSGARR